MSEPAPSYPSCTTGAIAVSSGTAPPSGWQLQPAGSVYVTNKLTLEGLTDTPRLEPASSGIQVSLIEHCHYFPSLLSPPAKYNSGSPRTPSSNYPMRSPSSSSCSSIGVPDHSPARSSAHIPFATTMSIMRTSKTFFISAARLDPNSRPSWVFLRQPLVIGLAVFTTIFSDWKEVSSVLSVPATALLEPTGNEKRKRSNKSGDEIHGG